MPFMALFPGEAAVNNNYLYLICDGAKRPLLAMDLYLARISGTRHQAQALMTSLVVANDPWYVSTGDVEVAAWPEWVSNPYFEVERQPAVDRSLYPHTCGCGASAYVSFQRIECSNNACPGVLKGAIW